MKMEDVQKIKRICDSYQLLLATAESVTVGRLQSIIGAVSGASTFFRGGITAYNIEQKVQLLDVERAHAELVNCVSPQIAAEMAEGATRIFQTDIGLATTGYAEPPDISEPSVSYAFFAIWDKSEAHGNPVRSGKMKSNGADRIGTQKFYADCALRELVAYLSSRKEVKKQSDDILRIERLQNGRYRLGKMIVDDISSVNGAVKAIKRPIPVTALQLNEQFEVVTNEGILNGKVGDWVIQGVMGEVYVCPNEVFRRSYDYS